jgi:hypothetical protein
MNPGCIILEELPELIRACDAFEIDKCTPPYFQDFVATQVADRFPDLSMKVRQLNSDQVDRLCECIRAAQAFLGL